MALTLNGTSGIVGAGIGTLDSSGANVTGVVTATSFVGSGANLTGITGTTINSNADNRIITGSGTANTLNGESTLTYDGSALAYSSGGSERFNLAHTSGGIVALKNPSNAALTFGTNNTERMRIRSGGGVGISTDKIHNASSLNIAGTTRDYTNASIDLMDAGGLILQPTNTLPSTGQSYPGIFWTGNTESLGRARAGILGVARSNNDATDLVFIAKVNAGGAGIHPSDEKMRILNGGGITFNGDTAAANALDDYEEGTWTPADGGGIVGFAAATGTYTKIGNLVTLSIYLRCTSSVTSGSDAYIVGLPFTSVGTNGAGNGGLAIGANNSADDFFSAHMNTSSTVLYMYKDNYAKMTKAQMWDGASTAKYLVGTFQYMTS